LSKQTIDLFLGFLNYGLILKMGLKEFRLTLH